MSVSEDALAPAAAVTPRPPVRTGAKVVRLLVVAVILGLLLGGLYAFNQFKAKAIADFFAGHKPPPTPVEVATAATRTIPKSLSAIGSLVAGRQVVLSPEVAGRVVALSFESGARVMAGQPLVQLNDAVEQADLLAWRAQARLAEANLARSRDLLLRQAGPQTAVEQNQAKLDEANANILRTEALIAQKLIRAPFSGDLGIRNTHVGDTINPGAAIVTLTDLSLLFVNFTLPEHMLSQLGIGQAVEVESDSAPGQVFRAYLTTIDPQVSPTTRAIRVQATLDNPQRLLLPGMFANVRVVLPPRAGALVVPETAVDFTVYGDSVFVVTPDADGKGHVVNRAVVKTGDRLVNGVEINEGLAPGARVVISGQNKLSNGAAVAPMDTPILVAPAQMPTH